MSRPELDVAVIGAGISGLAAAFWLRQAGRSVEVFEAADVVGGRMRSYQQDGYIIESGTETLARHGYDSTWRLIRDVGLGDGDVLPVKSMVAVWRNGRPHIGVGHPLGALTGSGLSLAGRMALTTMVVSLLPGARRFDTRRPAQSPLGLATVAEFARTRHPELLDYMLQPAVGTAWGWQPERSCIAPMVATMLSTRGLTGWLTYRGGMDVLARRLAEQVPVHTGTPLAEVTEGPAGVQLLFQDGQSLTTRSALLAVPAPIALALYPSMPADERDYVVASTFAPMIRVTCTLDRDLQLPRQRGLPGIYALLIPQREDNLLSGLTVEHHKAANRAPAGRGLISLLSARGATENLIDQPDEEISTTLVDRGERFLPGLGQACLRAEVHRFPYGAPEATPDAVRRHAAFIDRPARRIEYAGDWIYQRPASEAAVQSAELAVSRLLSAST